LYIQALRLNGNKIINEKLELHVPASIIKPDASSPSDVREQYIRAKYER
jgi:hypothetical protein